MGKQRREILVRVIFAKSSLSVLARCKQTEKWHPLFAYLSDECDSIIDSVFMRKLKREKQKVKGEKDALYVDRAVEFIREKLLNVREVDSNAEEDKHANIYLCSAVIILLDDAWNIASKSIKKIIDPILSEACRMELKFDSKDSFNDIRDDAVEFVEEIYTALKDFDSIKG